MTALTKKKLKKRYCFKKTSGSTKITVPSNIANELEIKDGEEPKWDKAKYRDEKQKLKVKITRGESTFDD